MSDRFDLQRFVEAQAPFVDAALAELAVRRKRTHWMWFVFPQIAGLGHSPTAQRYAIGSLDEVRAYLAHPVLGPRLRQATETVLHVLGRSAHDLFGAPDDMKLRSSMTLFAQAALEDTVFAQVLERYFNGRPDDATLSRLRDGADGSVSL